MDALHLGPGSKVADVGAGDGYFTFHLAERVGPGGRVYAEDIDSGVLGQVRARADSEGLKQVETILGTESDPKLPLHSLDAVLIVNAYHEMDEHDAMLKGVLRSLKSGGLLAIIDKQAEPGHDHAWYHSHHRINHEVVQYEAVRDGFEFVGTRPGFERADDHSNWYFLVFRKP